MAKKTKKTDVAPITLATRLDTLLLAKADIEAEEQEVRQELLHILKNQGVKSVRLEDGTTFTRTHRETLEVKNETAARTWAEEHHCLKIDTGKAMEVLRHQLDTPPFFGRKVGADYLVMKKKK